MLEKQISDLKKYFDSLNLNQKMDFLERLKVKIDKEKDVRVKNELVKLKNSCVNIYNSESLKKSIQINSIANKKITAGQK